MQLLELEIDEIRYHDSKKVSKTHQSYHIISERIITHTSQTKEIWWNQKRLEPYSFHAIHIPPCNASTLLEETPHCFLDGQPQMTVVRMYGCWFHQVTSSLFLALNWFYTEEFWTYQLPMVDSRDWQSWLIHSHLNSLMDDWTHLEYGCSWDIIQ